MTWRKNKKELPIEFKKIIDLSVTALENKCQTYQIIRQRLITDKQMMESFDLSSNAKEMLEKLAPYFYARGLYDAIEATDNEREKMKLAAGAIKRRYESRADIDV